jgi:hypothetical protein
LLDLSIIEVADENEISSLRSLNAVEGRMRNCLASIAAFAGIVAAGMIGAIVLQMLGRAAAQAPAPTAPPDTAALRAQYEQWRTEFKTWGKWAPVGQESRGTTNLITPEKVASALRLVKDGTVVSLAHAEPQTAAADVAPAAVFHRTTNGITDGGTTDNYQGELPRPGGRAYRHLVSLLRERADVQRRPSQGQRDERERLHQRRHHELEGRHHYACRTLRHRAAQGR